LIGEAEIDTQADSTGGETVTSGIPVAVHNNKVTEPGHPDVSALFRGLENLFVVD
jgi:hypothetical protein